MDIRRWHRILRKWTPCKKDVRYKLYFTAEFKEAFWNGYQAGVTPRKLLSDPGYDLSMFGQKQIDSIVQRIRKQAEAGSFTEGENRSRRVKVPPETADASPESITRMWNELKYLRQEVEFQKNSQ